MLRSYTLSNAPAGPQYRITVKREPLGLVSGFLHDSVAIGDLLEVAAPQGTFYLPTESRKPVVLLSGGVGITPMLSMVEAIAQEAAPREVWFIHGSRREDLQPLRRYLRNLSQAHAHVRVHTHHSEPGADERPGDEYDAVGQVDLTFLRTHLPHRDFDFYLCGPASFMETLYDGLRDWGVADDAIHYEYFGAGKTLQTQERIETPAEIFWNIALTRSGRHLNWTGEHPSLLALMEAHQIDMPYSCRVGTCLSCSTECLSGQISYDPVPLAEPFDGDILLCCARPQSDLVLNC